MSYFDNFDDALDKIIEEQEIEFMVVIIKNGIIAMPVEKLSYWNEEPYKLAEVNTDE